MVLPEGKCLREESLRFAQAGFDDGHPVADSLVPCKVKGNFRLKGIRTTNPVAVGDVVNYEMNREGFAFINRIETRRNYIIRRSSNLSKQAHIPEADTNTAKNDVRRPNYRRNAQKNRRNTYQKGSK